MADPTSAASQLRKAAALLREQEMALAEAHVKEAALILRAAKGLHILREKAEKNV